MAEHGRLPWREPAELSGAARGLYDRIVSGPRARGAQAFPLTDEAGRLNGPFNVLLTVPELGDAVQALGAAIRYAGQLDNRAREIAILELSALRGCEFEWYAHVRVGARAGLSAAEIDGLRAGASIASFDEREALVRSVVRELVRSADIDDARFEAARALLGEALLVEIVLLVGYYDLLALALRVFRVPLPHGERAVFANRVDD